MNDKMILRMPSYCKEFRCSASECSDNCCIGWEIDIDEETYSHYMKVKGDFGKRLKENIKAEECYSFFLKGERCPFLNKENLCDIIIELGQESLCQICSDHPRFFEWYGSLKEGGVGLCCEEGARLILSSDNPLSFTEKEIPFEEGDEFENELFNCLYEAREKVFSVLDNEDLSIGERVGRMLIFAERLQYNIDNYDYTLPEGEDIPFIKGDMLSVLRSFEETEPIDEKWPLYLKKLTEGYEEIKEGKIKDSYKKNLLIYFIYRYFLKGVFDGEILSKVKLAAVSTAVISYIAEKEQAYDTDKLKDVCKLYSKQIEYSQENLDILSDMFYEKDFYSSEKIRGLYI